MKVLDVILKIFAILLCIVMVPVIMSASVMWTATSIVQPKSIANVIQSVDYAAVISEDADFSKELEEMNVDVEAVEKIMESDVVEDVVELYVNDLTAVLEGKEVDGITIDDFKKIFDDNFDEIVEIVEDVSKEEVNKEEFKEQIDTFFEEEMTEVVNEMPQIQDIAKEMDIDTESMEMVRTFTEGTVFKSVLMVTLILAAIIFVLRITKLSGFIYLGITGIIAFVFMLVLRLGAGSLLNFAAQDSADAAVGADLIGNMIIPKLTTVVIVLFVVSAVFMAAHFVIQFFRKKEKQ